MQITIFVTDDEPAIRSAIVKRLSRKKHRVVGYESGDALLAAGTQLRFDEIWLEGNFETGIYVHPYATALDGPLQDQLIGIGFITDRTTEPGTRRERCNVNPAHLELVAR